MALSDQDKYKVISRLLNNDKPAIVADELELPYASVIRLNRELREAQANGDVSSVLNLDEAVFQELVAEVKDNVPDALLPKATEVLTNLGEAKSAIDQLQLDLQLSAKVVVDRAKTMALGAESASELECLAETLCKIQTAFFNKNVTQVNVQNNYGTDGKYTSLLSDAPEQVVNN